MTIAQTTAGATDAGRIPRTFAPALAGPSKKPERGDIDRVSTMPLSEFASAGLVVRVRSKALGETVLFASDNARFENEESLAVYRASELIALLDSPVPGLPARQTP